METQKLFRSAIILGSFSLASHADDANRTIDLEVARAESQDVFNVVDIDGDGLISPEEFQQSDPRKALAKQRYRKNSVPSKTRQNGRPGRPLDDPGKHMKGDRKPTGKNGHRMGRPEHRRSPKPPHKPGKVPQANESFDLVDIDGNGALSREEFDGRRKVFATEAKKKMFARLDRNEDGQLDNTEFPPYLVEWDNLDTNQDGLLSVEERRAGSHSRRALKKNTSE